jgi:signal transduction histidine kinase
MPAPAQDITLGVLAMAGCLTMSIMELAWGGGRAGHALAVQPAGLMLTVALCAPTVTRRRWPIASAMASGLVMITGMALRYGLPGGDVVISAACISAAYYRPPVLSAMGVSAIMIGFTAVNRQVYGAPLSPVDVVQSVVHGLLLVAAGVAVRAERERRRQLALVHEMRMETREARQRAQIAGNVHDIVGHHLCAIRMQAVGAQHLPDDPQVSRQVFKTVTDLADEALVEIRGLIDTLDSTRQSGTSAGLDDLEPLCRRLSTAGFRVDLRRPPDGRAVDTAVQQAAYHIVQEALTNAVRHSGGRTVRVGIDLGDHALVLEVTDDGQAGSPVEAGHGIRGMRARAHAVGGTLHAGAAEPYGWQVRAVLPV